MSFYCFVKLIKSSKICYFMIFLALCYIDAFWYCLKTDLRRGKCMQVTYKCNGSSCVVNLCGELDDYSASFVRERLDDIISSLQPFSQVVIDFQNVSFMDSTGIGVLIGRYKKFEPSLISFSVKNPNRTVDRILKMTGIYNIIPKID